VLLQEMLRRAAQNGQDRFGLYVRHSNVGAINAYLRAGFRIVASLADQYYMEIALRPLASSDTV
jgi:ribosomal protein S18 acetylase RimI-like enzyme